MAGFTLVEAIMVIVITGILASMVAVFMVRPVEGYVDSVRRADLTDAADSALRRMARDVRAALPNSLRQPGDRCIEFLPMTAGGRYATASGDILDFTAADTSFNVFGYNGAAPSAGQSLVVYNLGIPGSADAYGNPGASTSTRALIAAGSTAANIAISNKQFPFESPGRRFQVLATDGSNSYSVVYACVGAATDAAGNGTGVVYRYARTLPAAAPLAALSSCPAARPDGSSVLVRDVASCSFAYNPVVNQRNGQLTMILELRQANESVRLYHEVHVNNVP